MLYWSQIIWRIIVFISASLSDFHQDFTCIYLSRKQKIQQTFSAISYYLQFIFFPVFLSFLCVIASCLVLLFLQHEFEVAFVICILHAWSQHSLNLNPSPVILNCIFPIFWIWIYHHYGFSFFISPQSSSRFQLQNHLYNSSIF